MPEVEKIPTASTNPFYGCAIFIILASIIGGMVSWVLYSGYRQNKEIGEFTVSEAQTLPVPVVSEELKTALQMKLASFTEVAVNGKPVTLTLSVEEMNGLLVMAGEKGIADYRGMIVITGIDSQAKTILADVCWPMNNLPFSNKSKRYLVGKGAFSPIIEANGFDIKIHNIQVPGKVVSTGFLESLQLWPWLNLAKLNKDVAATMQKVATFGFSSDGTSFYLEANKTVEATPAP